MIQKKHKLTTKEVNYLLRRRQAIYVWWYKVLHCDQYTNNPHHQTGIQVSAKIHKHAVQRNIIRRAYYAAREDMIDKVVVNRYHKIFVVLHIDHCTHIITILNSNDSKLIHWQLKQHFSQIITSTLWKLQTPTSYWSWVKPNSSGRRS